MIPKKQSEIVKQVSLNTNRKESLVDDVVSFYYKELRKKLIDLEDVRINVPKLGIFVARKGHIIKRIKDFDDYKAFSKAKSLRGSIARKEQEELNVKLKALLEKINKASEEKQIFKAKKYESKKDL